MKVSIVIPIYQVESYIADCVRSIIMQHYTNLEVILVDDCTLDASMQIAKTTFENSEFRGEVKYFRHEKNKGISAARNTGIAHATGDYLYFLDSDDEIAPDCIELLVSKIEQYDYAIGNYQVRNSHKKLSSLKLKDGTVVKGDDVFKSFRKGKCYVMAWNKLVKKELIVKKQLYFAEGLIHEDELWSFMLATVAKSFVVVDKTTYFYKVREDSTTSSPLKKRLSNLCTIYQKMIDYTLQKNMQAKTSIVRYLDRFAYYIYTSLLSQIEDREEQKNIYREIRAQQQRYFIPFKNKSYKRVIHLFLPSRLGFKYIKSKAAKQKKEKA